FVPFFFILSLRQAGHLISRVIRISLFYQNPTCFFSAYFLKHHP
ncbi:APH(3'') family aminoglycoside O-phosphotransferase, partial [Acinetobacter sp. ACNIH3]